MSKKIDFKKIGMVIGGGLAGIAAAKLLNDKAEFVKDVNIRKVAMPAVVVAGAIYASMKFPKYSDAIVGTVAGAGILLTGGVLDYMKKSGTKTEMFALAGDGSQEIEFGSFEEMQDYVSASLPKQESRLLSGSDEELDGDYLGIVQESV